jgi:hypothetical protein
MKRVFFIFKLRDFWIELEMYLKIWQRSSGQTRSVGNRHGPPGPFPPARAERQVPTCAVPSPHPTAHSTPCHHRTPKPTASTVAIAPLQSLPHAVLILPHPWMKQRYFLSPRFPIAIVLHHPVPLTASVAGESPSQAPRHNVARALEIHLCVEHLLVPPSAMRPVPETC